MLQKIHASSVTISITILELDFVLRSFGNCFWKITASPCLGYTGYTQPITHPLISGSAAPAAPEPVPGWAGFTPAPVYQPQQQVDPAK